MLSSCAVTTQLICTIAFANAENRFSHDTAQIIIILTMKVPFVPNTLVAMTATMADLDIAIEIT